MATATLLSHHSSNPLEVGSSDVRNNAYNQRYRASLARNDALSSDDPISGYTVPDELQQYHDHLSRVLPAHPALGRTPNPPPEYIDLDEDMSDDELATPLARQDNERTLQLPRGPHEDESNEGGHSDKDEAHDYDEDDDDRMSVDDPESDEEDTILAKSPEERKEIEEEIHDLLESVPQLKDDYKVVDRLGTGTFSSVYKAVDLHYHTKWDNSPWHGHHPLPSTAHYQSVPRPPGSKVFVAIKRIYVTSSPERIRNEVSIMLDCLNCRHVSQLITATRSYDQVVLIMPYQRNEDFREYYRSLSMLAVKAYLRCLLQALRDIHDRKIIHRDVKPANFLFDPRTGIGTLCDFGLASRMQSGSAHGQCLHTGHTEQYPHGHIRHLSENEKEWVRKMQKEARNKATLPPEKVGYPEKDTRPISKANRAGTRGFRAPEVLLKCSEQTGALDVWSAGMILLFFLTGKFPIFQSNDDIEALMEIAAIIGRKQMEKTATLHSRLFMSNVPSVPSEGMTWRDFAKKLNPDLYTPKEADISYYPFNTPEYRAYLQEAEKPQPLPPLPPSSPRSSPADDLNDPQSRAQSPSLSRSPFSPEQYREDVEAALDLLEQLLHPECTKRITPKRALAHPFLAGKPGTDDVLPDDDEFVPHVFGKGVCGSLHFVDEVTDEQCVRIRVRCECGKCNEEREEVRAVAPGEGIAIGRQPCEFHRDMDF